MKHPLLIHHGAEKFNAKLFYTIRNMSWCKPDGGLWSSPVNSEHSWKQWCREENFRLSGLEKSFLFALKDNARIYVINSKNDLMNAPLINPYKDYSNVPERWFIDFEKLSERFDAVWLTEKGEHATRWSKPASLYGWDCESVLVMNKDCIMDVQLVSVNNIVQSV